MVDKYTEAVLLPQPPSSLEGLLIWASALVQSLQPVLARLDNANIFPLYDAKGRTVIDKDGVFVYGVGGSPVVSPDNLQITGDDIAPNAIAAKHMTGDSINNEAIQASSVSIDKLEETTTTVLTLNTTQRNALTTAKRGTIIYNTTDLKFQGYNGSTWDNLN